MWVRAMLRCRRPLSTGKPPARTPKAVLGGTRKTRSRSSKPILVFPWVDKFHMIEILVVFPDSIPDLSENREENQTRQCIPCVPQNI